MEESAFQAQNQETRRTQSEERTTPGAGRRLGYLIAVLLNFVGLWVLRNLGVWLDPIITEEWARVLPALELSVYGAIVAYLVYLFYDARWVKRAGQIGMNLLSLRATRQVYRIFPFDFGGGPLEGLVRIALIIGIVGTVVSTVVEIVRLLLGRD